MKAIDTCLLPADCSHDLKKPLYEGRATVIVPQDMQFRLVGHIKQWTVDHALLLYCLLLPFTHHSDAHSCCYQAHGSLGLMHCLHKSWLKSSLLAKLNKLIIDTRHELTGHRDPCFLREICEQNGV